MAYTTIDDPSAYFQTALWSGDNATTQNITNDGNSDLQPDWVWVKCRNTAGNGFDHTVWDTSRGVDDNVNKSLSPSQTDSEGLGDNVTSTAQLGGVSAMLSDGFTVREGSIDNDARYVNESSRTYVGWQWKCNGGTTASNTDGTITSTVQANTTAGFSIVTYTHTGNDERVGHGLGATPKVVIVKERGGAGSWYFVTTAVDGSLDYLLLEGTNAKGDLGYSEHTSTTFPSMQFDNTDTAVAYCFAEKQGYSKFGKYTGNGNADGPFIYTGFKPAWVLFKKTSGADGWGIFDNKRGYQNAANPLDAYLQPNNSNAESAESDSIDFLSNGFKWRISSGFRNESGSTFIYMAFAESPFVGSDGVPTTAR